MNPYLDRLRAKMAEEGVPALFVSNITNVQWLTGFTGSSGFAIVTADDAVFITDSRYTIQAGEQVKGMKIEWFQRPTKFEDFVTQHMKSLGVTRCGFETSVTYSTWKNWIEKIDVDWYDAPDCIKPLRMIKSDEEVALIKEACAITDACLEHLQGLCQIGRSEYDIQLDLEFFLRRQGADIAFHPIVVSGANSARPHGFATEKLLKSGDFLTFDLGAKKNGYCSDITRTFVVGEVSDRHREIYNLLLKSQVAAVEALIPGTPASEPDRISREILDELDLSQYFGHGLGHGLGRDVHDFGGLGPNSTDTIEVGQVWTVEPGVYIEGFGGARIEDDVLVTADGPEILTHFPKELIVVG